MLQIGDIIDVLGDLQSDWCQGQIENRIGLFPSSFVQLIWITEYDISIAIRAKAGPDCSESLLGQFTCSAILGGT